MREIIREGIAFNGNTVRLEFSQNDLGGKYKIKFKKPGEYGFRFGASFKTVGEASNYYDMMITGGRR